MPGQKLLQQNEGFLEAWETYIARGILKTELIRTVIADSWIRSRKHGVDPLSQKIEVTLSHEELQKRYNQFMALVQTTKPFMSSLYKLVGNEGLIVRLTDKDGYVLECIGDQDLVKTYGNLSMYKGCNTKEEVIGTNAIGTALAIGGPIQVFGAEHYCKQFHNWTSSACPIRNENGRIIGILSMTGPSSNVHPHTLGMVVATAEAIGNEIKLERTNKRLDVANKHFYAIMESISEGLICVNSKGIVMDINLFARRLLAIKEEEIIGKHIGCILDEVHESKIIDMIHNGKKYEEEEMHFKSERRKRISCIVNVTPIKGQDSNEVEGTVFTFRAAKKVHSLVNKIVGAEAIYTFEDILGGSKLIKEAVKVASIAANTDTTILLLGESGVGKEMFAQAIHNESIRRKRPFVFLNCGAIPRDLVASELFGYVEGAFTGAKRGGHPGKFELADKGTIFLDEIGDMPLDAQVNLLRVLENKAVVRVGGHDVIPADVRVIAATHKDLLKEVEKGNFRSDLYYRLNVMPIQIPRLRDRKEDIKIFIDYFIDKFSRRMGKEIKDVHHSFYKAMIRYDWPGNVRELQNVMELVMNMVEDKADIGYEDLPSYMRSGEFIKEQRWGMKNDSFDLVEIEKNTIMKALDHAGGNMAQTAKLLGIGRSTLYRKIEKYNLEHLLK
ncbi:PAS domain S-box-containing protein [Anaerosolibacter carboniphilus]|uniref:PAS domain S-box-containing protein n=1 Tax=Anaerosolibacter carboniphilus TaxID=1417629 RepID=A0A841KUU1_9FIRM|nr:sigma 54-interacting transcriptional regulator [Anaerosolibacter carboniphilus]MBB6213939.1 PAS domain S-box-containing protein [Anaerosolibacter carboniphilus]